MMRSGPQRLIGSQKILVDVAVAETFFSSSILGLLSALVS
jgi:hypothetical protein